MSKLDSLRAALAHSPDNVPLLLVFGEACLEEFVADEARTTFETALRLAPTNPAATLGLARALHLLGRASEAILRTEALVTAHPRHSAAHLWLARWLLDDGNPAGARAAYQKALALDGVGDNAAHPPAHRPSP